MKDTRYLGVDLASDLSWKNHIERTCSKANRQLAFLRRNLQIQNTRVKKTAYKGLVRPVTEYCCTVWDSNYKKYKNQLESVQRRAARFVRNRYERQAPVTEMVNNLRWDPLELRRLRARLTTLFKIQQNLVAVPMPSVISVPVRSTLFISVTESYFNFLFTLLLCTIVTVWKTTSSKLDSMIHKTVNEKDTKIIENENKKSNNMEHKRCKTKL